MGVAGATPSKSLKSVQQQEVEQLHWEVAKVTTERNIQKNRSDTLPKIKHQVFTYRPAPAGLVDASQQDLAVDSRRAGDSIAPAAAARVKCITRIRASIRKRPIRDAAGVCSMRKRGDC